MDVLNIYPIGGLFYELYSPNPSQFNCSPLDVKDSNPLKRVNALFWAKLFSDRNINQLLSAMDKEDIEKLSKIEKAVLSNKNYSKN